MYRILLTTCFLIFAGLIIALAFYLGDSNQASDFLLNLGTEILGIALTVAIVEWLFEKRRISDDARKMAWRALHRLDHAVWVWQGGTRRFDLGELLGLLKSVDENDPLPEFTQNLFLRLGSDAQDTSRHEPDVVAANSELETALKCAAELSRIRDEKELMKSKEIAQFSYETAIHLARAVKLSVSIQESDELNKIRDASTEMQERRHFGIAL